MTQLLLVVLLEDNGQSSFGLRLGPEDLPEVKPRLGFMEGKLRNALVTVLPLKYCDCWCLWVTEVAPVLCTSELSRITVLGSVCLF